MKEEEEEECCLHTTIRCQKYLTKDKSSLTCWRHTKMNKTHLCLVLCHLCLFLCSEDCISWSVAVMCWNVKKWTNWWLSSAEYSYLHLTRVEPLTTTLEYCSEDIYYLCWSQNKIFLFSYFQLASDKWFVWSSQLW